MQPTARLAMLFAKLSILLFYLRIFFPAGVDRTTLWWLTWLTIVVNILYTIALVLATTLQCVPRGLPWGSSCINQYLVLIISSTINIISDIVVLVIPLFSIWALQMNRQTKWALWVLFAFGSLAPLASISRLAFQIVEANGTNKTVIYPVIVILALAEQTVAMVGGSIPIIRNTVVKMVTGKRSMTRLTPWHKPATTWQTSWPGQGNRHKLKRGFVQRLDETDESNSMPQGSTEILYPMTTLTSDSTRSGTRHSLKSGPGDERGSRTN